VASLTFRSAVSPDVDPVLAFWQKAAEDSNRPIDSPAAVRRLIERDADALVVAADGDAIVGSLIIGWDGWRCHLYRLAVDPDYRRRGIGGSLLAIAEERFVGFGGTRADAMVLDENEVAHRVWAAAGYAAQPEWSRWVKALGRSTAT